MVARAPPSALKPRIDYRMAEFFITRARRRLGIGETAVQLILSRFAGTLGDHRVFAQCRGGELLAAGGCGLHARE